MWRSACANPSRSGSGSRKRTRPIAYPGAAATPPEYWNTAGMKRKPPAEKPAVPAMSCSPWPQALSLLHAEFEFGLFHVLRKDHHRLAALQLEHRGVERADLAGGTELDAPEEGHGVERGERVAHLCRLERARLLDRELEYLAGGRGRGLRIIRLVLALRTPELVEVLGRSEHALAVVAYGRMPPGRARNILRQRADRVDVLLVGRAGDHGHDRRAHAEILHLLSDEDQVVDVTGREDPVGPSGAHLRDGRCVVHGADGILLEHDDVEIALLRRLLHLLADRQREQVVARKNGDALRVGVALDHDVRERLGQRVVGGERSEQILVTLIIDLRRRRGGRDGGYAVLLRHVAGGLGGPRPERRKQEVDLIVVDQTLGRLHGARRIGCIVDIDDLDLVGLPADRDAALGIGGPRPQVVALLLLDALWRQRAGQRQRRAHAHRILSECGGAQYQRGRQRKRRDGSKSLQSMTAHAHTMSLGCGEFARSRARPARANSRQWLTRAALPHLGSDDPSRTNRPRGR